MKTSTKPTLLTQSEYARHRGKSRQYISKLASSGVLVMVDGRIDRNASDLVLDDRPTSPADEVAAVAIDGEVLIGRTFAEAKTAAMIYDAKRKRLDYLEREGTLIEVATVKRVWSEIFAQLKKALLLAPEELGDHLAVESHPVKCRQLVRAKNDQILTEISRFDGATVA